VVPTLAKGLATVSRPLSSLVTYIYTISPYCSVPEGHLPIAQRFSAGGQAKAIQSRRDG
jgi:hypothetical protein